MRTEKNLIVIFQGAFGPLLYMLFLIPMCLFIFSGEAHGVGGKPQMVRHVYDGDTFQLVNGDVVRLAGVDAPELGHDGQPDQYYADDARKALHDLVDGRKIVIKRLGRKLDRFGRILAAVYLSDGRLVQDVLIARGVVFCLYYKDLPEAFQQRLLAIQGRAMQEGEGFWSKILSVRHAASGGFVGNRGSRRFGPTRCAALRKIKKGNSVFFENSYDAFFAGYAPYRECGLWPAD